MGYFDSRIEHIGENIGEQFKQKILELLPLIREHLGKSVEEAGPVLRQHIGKSIEEIGPKVSEHIASGIQTGAQKVKEDLLRDAVEARARAGQYLKDNAGKLGMYAGLSGLGLFGTAHLGAALPGYLAGRIDSDDSAPSEAKSSILKSMLIPGYYAYQRGANG